MTTERFADRGGRNLDPKAEQLALEALAAPAGVLGGQADDQLLQVLVESWTPASTLRVGPHAGDQVAAWRPSF